MKKILVVDDDETILTFLQFFLSKEGYQVLLAKDGLAAQEMIKKEVHFDLIISDIRMPRCDGLQLLKRVKETDLAHIPFIIMTGYSERREEEAYSLGASLHIEKPFDRKVLLEHLAKLLPS